MIPKNSLLLTKREVEAINAKLSRAKLTQQDSNCLSSYVRPKLREMALIDSRLLLRMIAYNQKIRSMEQRIKAIVLANVRHVSSITLYGSVVYSGYTDFKDIDVLVGVSRRFWADLGEKYRLIVKLKKMAGRAGLNLDIKIFLEKEIVESYPNNVTLIYELKDARQLYGKRALPKKVSITKDALLFHMDYSYSVLLDVNEYGLGEISGREIYSAIRNLWIIRLAADKVIDNARLIETLNAELGRNTIGSLKDDACSLLQKKIAADYLEGMYYETERMIKRMHCEITWEREM